MFVILHFLFAVVAVVVAIVVVVVVVVRDDMCQNLHLSQKT